MLQQSCLRGQPARRTRTPRPRMPVDAYLSTQAATHLFAPERNDDVIAEIQASVDAYWRAQADPRDPAKRKARHPAGDDGPE